MTDDPNARVAMKVLGVLVMVFGFAMAALSGLCTFYFGMTAVSMPGSTPADLVLPLILGGLPTLAGIVVVGVGVWMTFWGGRR